MSWYVHFGKIMCLAHVIVVAQLALSERDAAGQLSKSRATLEPAGAILSAVSPEAVCSRAAAPLPKGDVQSKTWSRNTQLYTHTYIHYIYIQKCEREGEREKENPPKSGEG